MLLRPVDGCRWQTIWGHPHIYGYMRKPAIYHIAYTLRGAYIHSRVLFAVFYLGSGFEWLEKTMTREMAFKWSSYELCQRKRERLRDKNWSLMQSRTKYCWLYGDYGGCKNTKTEKKRQKLVIDTQKTKSVWEVLFLFRLAVLVCWFLGNYEICGMCGVLEMYIRQYRSDLPEKRGTDNLWPTDCGL